MDVRTTPLVATSLNPKGDAGLQHRCLQAWRGAGFEFISFNAQREVTELLKLGFDQSCLASLGPSENASAIAGKPVPRIMAVLERMAFQSRTRPILLTNADLYPAIRSAAITKLWSRFSPVLAMTRQECISLVPTAVERAVPYRGGLDAFFFSTGALEHVVEGLRQFPVCERMAFGIPGWDYLLGGYILQRVSGGRILDSGVLCHVAHAQSYSALDELEYYLPALYELGICESESNHQVADHFSESIRLSCEQWASETDLVRCLFERVPDHRFNFSNETLLQAGAFLDEWSGRCPVLVEELDLAVMASVIDRLRQEPNAVMSITASALITSPSRLMCFTQALLAIVTALRFSDGRIAKRIKTSYPEVNQHRAALENILNRHSESNPERRFRVALLFGAEFLDYGIFNPRLYNYLALSCRNHVERELLMEIGSNAGVDHA